VEWVTTWIFVNVFVLAPVITTTWFAARWRRNAVVWGLCALPFSWLAFGVLAIVGERGRSEETARALERAGAPQAARGFRPYPVEPPRVRTLVLWLLGTVSLTAALSISTLFAAPPHDPRLVTMEEGKPVAFHTDEAQRLVLGYVRADGLTFERWSRALLAALCSNVDPDRVRFQTYVGFKRPDSIGFIVSMSYDEPGSGSCSERRLGALLGAIAGIESDGARLMSVFSNGSIDTHDGGPVTWLDEFESGLDP